MKRAGFGVLLMWLVLSGFALADGFREQFRKAFLVNDASAVEKVLASWEKAMPRDPDLYVAQFNWLLKKGERIELKSGPPKQSESLVIKDKKGKTVGNMGSGYDPGLVEQAGAALTKGLSYAPDRLDMHFGLAKLYEMTGQPKLQIAALRNALANHPKNGQPWRWRDGGALPASEELFVPGSLEEYASFYWQQEPTEALEHGRAIAELIEQYYPKSSLGPFNVGVYYAITKQPAQAYAKLQQADKLAPDDPSTVGNLTKLAIELKRKDEAAKYLARLQKLPNSKADAEEFAKEIQKL
jgi:Tfp pilus assembly protein PilF